MQPRKPHAPKRSSQLFEQSPPNGLQPSLEEQQAGRVVFVAEQSVVGAHCALHLSRSCAQLHCAVQLLLQLSKAGHDSVGPAVGRGVGAIDSGAMLGVKEDGVKDAFVTAVGATEEGIEVFVSTVGEEDGAVEGMKDVLLRLVPSRQGSVLQTPRHDE